MSNHFNLREKGRETLTTFNYQDPDLFVPSEAVRHWKLRCSAGHNHSLTWKVLGFTLITSALEIPGRAALIFLPCFSQEALGNLDGGGSSNSYLALSVPSGIIGLGLQAWWCIRIVYWPSDEDRLPGSMLAFLFFFKQCCGIEERIYTQLYRRYCIAIYFRESLLYSAVEKIYGKFSPLTIILVHSSSFKEHPRKIIVQKECWSGWESSPDIVKVFVMLNGPFLSSEWDTMP